MTSPQQPLAAPRILVIGGFPDSLLHFRGAFLDALVARGFEVHVATPGLAAGHPVHGLVEARSMVAHAIPLRRTGLNPLGDLLLLLHLRGLMRSIRPDVVLAYTIKPVIYGSLAAWMARVPRRFALITGLGYAFQGEGQRMIVRGLAQKLYALALARVSKVFFQNPDDQALFRERGILKTGVPSVVLNGSGIDLDEYPLSSPATEPLQFLMIGRLLGDKGVREYAAAAAKAKARNPEARFLLAGWIDENPDAIAQSELDAWVASGCIEFIGRLADVRPAIVSSAVYVLPSYREGTPRTVLEAMAMGRPIITTDTPGCRETVAEGDNGFLVPVRSVDGLVAAMQRFLDDPTLAARMGARSRQIAEEKYDVHKVNEMMLSEMGVPQKPAVVADRRPPGGAVARARDVDGGFVP